MTFLCKEMPNLLGRFLFTCIQQNVYLIIFLNHILFMLFAATALTASSENLKHKRPNWSYSYVHVFFMITATLTPCSSTPVQSSVVNFIMYMDVDTW